MSIVNLILILALGMLSLAVLYLYFLALVGLVGIRFYPEITGDFDFLILIPAHNEEKVIGAALQNLNKLKPVGKLEIAVIADNCTDSTAAIARQSGYTVIQRTDEKLKGKGYALEWAIGQYDLTQYDAVAIVDADTMVQSNMLEAMAQSLVAGAGAVQLYYGFSVEQKTALSHLQLMANIVENVLFYGSRAILGLPILLRGTGMAIKAEVLQKYPWDSHSITEDVEYAVKLLVNKVRIDFNTESLVHAPSTSSYEQSQSQKLRWAAGTFELIKNKTWPLLRQGFREGRFDLVELGLSFLLLSRPFLIYLAGIGLILSLFAVPGSKAAFALWALILIALLVIYILAGIIFVKDKKVSIKALAQVPRYAIWFLGVQVTALVNSGKLGWTRTERKVNDEN